MKPLALIALLLLATPADAACRLALALGLDISASVDAREYRLQRDGVASALMDADVQAAIFALPGAEVRILVYEWSDQTDQTVLVDWTALTSPAALATVAARIRDLGTAAPRTSSAPTALGQAILFGADRLSSQAGCWQLKLDVSGDGQNNQGPPPEAVRTLPALAGITVNALVIGADSRHAGVADRRQAEIKELLSYFASRVITGPGAFTEAALTYDDYAAAMRRKLLRELQVMAVARTPLPGPNRPRARAVLRQIAPQ